MPVFIWGFGSGDRGTFYAFPAVNGIDGGLKVASEQYEFPSDPDDLRTDVTPDGESLAQWATDGRPAIDLSAFALRRFS